LKNRVAQILAAALVLVSVCIGGGYRHWWEALIGIAAAFIYLQTLRAPGPQSENRA
jgi:hypothetical protein